MGCATSKATNLVQQKPEYFNGISQHDFKPAPPELIISDNDFPEKDFDLKNSKNGEAAHPVNSNTNTEIENTEQSDESDHGQQTTPKVSNTAISQATPRQATVIVPQQATESDIQQQLDAFKMQQEINADNLNQQQLRSKLALKEKLKQRKQKKLGNEAGVVVCEPEVAPDAQANVESLVDSKIDEAPNPAAPTTSKDVLYSDDNIALFNDLEKYAVSLESSHVTFETLMKNLFISDLSDLEKVRILFHWITAQNLNSIQFPPSMPEDSPLAYLKAVKDDIKSYASLFHRLCHAAGLHAKLVQGYLKGLGYTPDYIFSGVSDPLRGTWNAVLIDRQWRLIDTHWGARHVNEENTVSREKWQTEYRYEEHYFLTDPDMLINTHFPDDKAWQLLPKPITLDQFQTTIKQWPLYYKLKLTQNSHQTGVISADEHGYVQIKLGVFLFGRADAKFKGELRHRERTGNSPDLQQYVMHHSKPDVEIFEIFLPSPGKFLFKVFGLSSKFSEDELFTNICLYQIECPKIKSPPATSYHPPFPVVNFCYGPSKTMHDLGLEAKSHLGPVVQCDEKGEAKIVLSLPKGKTKLSFSQDLQDLNLKPFPNSAIHCLVPDQSNPKLNQLAVHVRVPYDGNFVVSLYCGQNNESGPGSLSAFCHYLVTSNKLGKTPVNLFPDVPNGTLGKVEPTFSDLGMNLVSTSGGDMEFWLKPDDKGESHFTFTHSQPLVLIANLLSSSATHDDFVTVLTDGTSSTVLIRTPSNATAGEIFLLKLYAAPIQQAKGLPCAFTAFVTCTPTTQNTSPLPQSSNRIWGSYGDRFYACGVKKVYFRNSTSAIASTTQAFSGTSPFRCYKGGADFELAMTHDSPLLLKPRLSKIDGFQSTELEGFAFVSETSTTESVIHARFTEAGVYSLSVFGESVADNRGQLSPLHNTLVQVDSPSQCKVPFPTSLNVWTMSSVHLAQPLQAEIPRNVPTDIKLSLGRYQQTEGQFVTVPYHRVLLLIDDVTPQEPVASANCEYEWSYIAGPGEKKVGVIVQSSESNQSMNYALQFSITD